MKILKTNLSLRTAMILTSATRRVAAVLFTMLLTMTAETVWADQSGNWTYETLVEGTCMITGYTGDKRVESIDIPIALSGYRVTGFAGSFRFTDFPNLSTIVFVNNGYITTMPLVKDCSKLTKINSGAYNDYLANSITMIPDNCFTGTAISTLQMDNLTSIGSRAFYGCPLTNVKIGSLISQNATIGNEAFSNISTNCTIRYCGAMDNWTWRKYENSPNLLVVVVANHGTSQERTMYRGWCGGSDASSHNRVEWKLDSDGLLTISCPDETTWDYYPDYQAITTHRWTENSYKDKVKQLSVERVTSICANAFVGCTNLTSVTIEGNPKIADGAFPGGAKVTMNLTANGPVDGYKWMTFYNDRYNFQADENTKVYKATVSGNSLALAEVEDRIVNASTPVILKSTGDPVMTLTTTASSDTHGNDLKGVMTATDTPENCYTLSANNGKVGFYKYSGTTVAAGKAYLIYTGSASARGFIGFGDDDETTGISDASHLMDNGEWIMDNEAGAWYDLSGRKLAGQPTKKGIYVRDGRKVVIK